MTTDPARWEMQCRFGGARARPGARATHSSAACHCQSACGMQMLGVWDLCMYAAASLRSVGFASRDELRAQNKFGTLSTSAGPSRTPCVRRAPPPDRVAGRGNRRSCVERSRIEAGCIAAACERPGWMDWLIGPIPSASIFFLMRGSGALAGFCCGARSVPWSMALQVALQQSEQPRKVATYVFCVRACLSISRCTVVDLYPTSSRVLMTVGASTSGGPRLFTQYVWKTVRAMEFAASPWLPGDGECRVVKLLFMASLETLYHIPMLFLFF